MRRPTAAMSPSPASSRNSLPSSRACCRSMQALAARQYDRSSWDEHAQRHRRTAMRSDRAMNGRRCSRGQRCLRRAGAVARRGGRRIPLTAREKCHLDAGGFERPAPAPRFSRSRLAASPGRRDGDALDAASDPRRRSGSAPTKRKGSRHRARSPNSARRGQRGRMAEDRKKRNPRDRRRGDPARQDAAQDRALRRAGGARPAIGRAAGKPGRGRHRSRRHAADPCLVAVGAYRRRSLPTRAARCCSASPAKAIRWRIRASAYAAGPRGWSAARRSRRAPSGAISTAIPRPSSMPASAISPSSAWRSSAPASMAASARPITWRATDLVFDGPANDELADAEQPALDHMNADHRDAIDVYARAFAKATDDGWSLTGIDAEGIDIASRRRQPASLLRRTARQRRRIAPDFGRARAAGETVDRSDVTKFATGLKCTCRSRC